MDFRHNLLCDGSRRHRYDPRARLATRSRPRHKLEDPRNFMERKAHHAKAGKDLPTIPEEFMEFIDVFSEELFKKLPEHRSFDCNIDFQEGSDLPKPAKVYPLSPIESRTIKEFIDQELADGKIRPSKSPIASPCFFVKKKDGS
ncbi:Retrotransposable element Tf2 protein [Ceratobasidium sp. AG-Ba]|nr:Retrotransposable element Tf2 protein [Ceratobasidium sp. AG-Ba]